ncbi:MAG: hypothetical protein GY894_11600 [Planctomycetes bacterium]|nr:hypothetical protein [Planctomycetota bacterium]MCP4839982.1 hypothetical protein [Planctomycetota bacterium]
MNVSRMIGLALAGVVTPGLLADDGEALRLKIAELEAQQQQTNSLLDSLQGDLDRVRAETSDNWLSEVRAEQIRGLVQDVLADADTRASLQGNGATSGYDNGFFIASPDGNFKLTMNANMQFRFAWNHRDNPSAAAVSTGQINPTQDDLWGFSNQRTALIFKGHAFDPSITYFIQSMWNSQYGNGLADAWIGKSFDGGWSVKAGKFRMPFMRETLIGYNQQLAVDRTLMQYYLGIGRSQGLQAQYMGDNIRFTAAALEAFQNITGIGGIGPIGTTTDSIGFAARLDYLMQGSWGDVKNYTAFSPSETSILLGAAVAYSTLDQGLTALGGSGQQTDLRWTADATANFDGGSLAAAVVMANLSEDPNIAAGYGGRERDTVWGFNLQGGFFLADDVQAFARYEWADSMYAGSDDLSVLQFGVNVYWYGQRLKWTTDVGYSFNELPSEYFYLVQAPGAVGNGGTNLTGWTPDAGDGQWLIRSQVQLCF